MTPVAMLKSRSAGKSTSPGFLMEDLEFAEEAMCRQAERSFWAYRQLMHPNMLKGWFQRDVAHKLQRFYERLIAGERPKLILMAPPQHGKSDTITDFIAWISGKHPELKTIFASFSSRLGVRTNLRIQRQMSSDRYKRIFRDGARLAESAADGYQRNQELIEFVGKEGSFRNTTVEGSITGESLDLGVIDDPMKGRAEANSPTRREGVWNWFTDDFNTRFSENAGMLMILTRWHIDDPAGRMVDADPTIEVVRYKAIADEDEFNEEGELVRRKGEALFPGHKSLSFLMARKRVMTESSWQSIYQQSPIVVGGELFPVNCFRLVPFIPKGVNILKTVRYWDKAGTQDGGKFTAGVLMAKLSDGRFIVLDVVRKQLNYHNREQLIKTTARDDGVSTTVWVEQEPGSGGKESAQRTVANIPGYTVYADKVQGDKYTRAEPYAGQVQGENVLLLTAPWNKKFLEEHEFFPNGPFKDQVDAAAGAFAKLTDETGKKAGTLW